MSEEIKEEAATAFPETWQPNMVANLVFLTRGQEVLLIHKKTGLGAGKINGPGGKLEPGESPLEGAIREVEVGPGMTVVGDCDADGAIIQYNCYLGIMLKDENLAYLEDFIDQIMHVADLFQKDNDLTAAIAFLKIAFFSVRQEITTKNNPTRLWGDHPIKI